MAKPRIDPSGAVDGRTYGQRAHDALEDLCDRQLRAGDAPDTGGIPATVIVTIDADDLINRVGHGRTADGTVLPTAKLLQLANNADIIPTVLTASRGGAGSGPQPADRQPPANPGADRPRRRLLLPRLRPPTAILRKTPHPRVDRRRSDEPEQLTLVCAYHHHNFLARGWTCRINTDGLPEWTPPKWVDRDQKPMINTRIQAVLTARKRAQRNKPIIR